MAISTKYILAVLFISGVLTISMFWIDFPWKTYNYISKTANAFFMATGYLLSLMIINKAQIDSTTKFLISGMVILCSGSLIVTLLDMNYTSRLWGKLFPLSCGALFISGLIHNYGNATDRK